MVNWSQVWLIFRKELQDQLRDRRTIMVLIGIPFAIYLVFGLGLSGLMSTLNQQPALILVAGDPPPDSLPFLSQEGLDSRWIKQGDHAAFRVGNLTGSVHSTGSENPNSSAAASLRELQTLVAARLNAVQLKDSGRALTESQSTAASFNNKVTRVLEEHRAEAIVLLPSVSSDSAPLTPPSSELSRPVILFNSSSAASVRTAQQVSQSLIAWMRAVAEIRMSAMLSGLPFPSLEPIALDAATQAERSSNVWALIFPALIVIMTVLGAFYPAIDLCAGERERGTLETLLISPARRIEIVLGKFLLVMGFSCFSALINLVSLGMVGQSAILRVSQAQAGAARIVELPSIGTMGWVLVVMVLISAPFSALSIALASFARSTKEAQFYVAPLMGVALVVTVSCLLPGVTLTAFHTALPVIGPVLWLKALLREGLSGLLLSNLLLVVAGSASWSLLAILMAAEQFKDERILFPDSESFQPVRSLRKLMREKLILPSPVMAAVCFISMLLLQVILGLPLARQIQSGAGSGVSGFLLQIILQQTVSLIAPAVLIAWLFTRSVRQTLGLNAVAPSSLLCAVLFGAALHPLMFEFSHATHSFFPEVLNSVQSVVDQLNQHNLSPVIFLLVFAVIPGVCEELAFRGLILAGFRSRMHHPLPLLLSSLLFGVMYIVPHHAFNAVLLGIPLAGLTLRQKSLFPAMAAHVTYKCCEVLRAVLMEPQSDGIQVLSVANQSPFAQYTHWTLALASLTAVGSFWLLTRRPSRSSALQPEASPAT